MTGLQYVVYTLFPTSVEQFAEVRDLYLERIISPIDSFQVAYLLKSAASPENIPTSLATVRLIQTTNQGFIGELWSLSWQAKSIREQFHQVRQLYEIHDIQNKVPDGRISFPEDSRSLASGIEVEFRYVSWTSPPLRQLRLLWISRNVSFRYPDKEDFALRDVSFKIEKGQLCVSPPFQRLCSLVHI